MASKAISIEVPGPDGETRQVRVSSPDRVMWPDDGITKEALARIKDEFRLHLAKVAPEIKATF